MATPHKRNQIDNIPQAIGNAGRLSGVNVYYGQLAGNSFSSVSSSDTKTLFTLNEQSSQYDGLRFREDARTIATLSPLIKNYLKRIVVAIISDESIEPKFRWYDRRDETQQGFLDGVSEAFTNYYLSDIARNGQNGIEFERLAFRHLIIDGEVFFARGDSKWRLIESEMVDEHDADNWTIKTDAGDIIIDKQTLMQIYEPSTINQKRGVSWLRTAMPYAFALAYSDKNMAVNNEILTRILTLIENLDPSIASSAPDAAGMFGLQASNSTKDSSGDGETEGFFRRLTNRLLNNTALTLARGHKLSAPPSGAHTETARQIQKLESKIASSLGVSLSGIKADFTEHNFASLKVGTAYDADEYRQSATVFYSKLRAKIFQHWLKTNYSSSEVVMINAALPYWKPPTLASTEPLKATQTTIAQLEAGLTSEHEQGISKTNSTNEA